MFFDDPALRIVVQALNSGFLKTLQLFATTLVGAIPLGLIIALQEIIWMGESFLKGNQGYSGLVWPLFFTGLYYLIFNGVVTVLLGRLEKKLDYFRA